MIFEFLVPLENALRVDARDDVRHDDHDLEKFGQKVFPFGLKVHGSHLKDCAKDMSPALELEAKHFVIVNVNFDRRRVVTLLADCERCRKHCQVHDDMPLDHLEALQRFF